MKRMDWNHIRAFHATASTGSLSAAARQLGLTQPTLSRQIIALEGELGVMLFERVGRKLLLTQTARELLDHVRAMGDAAETVSLAASGRVLDIGGEVSISATDTYAAYILPAIIERIRSEAPQITIIVISDNALSNLQRREADIAIRHVRPNQAELVSRQLPDSSAHFYASAGWVATHGLPRTPQELAKAGLIGFGDAERDAGYFRSIGIPVAAEDFRLISANSVVVWEMVKRGMGVTAMLREIAALTPGIVQVLSDLPPIPVPIWLVTHRELHTSRRIRIVHDILAEELTKLCIRDNEDDFGG